jgi:amidase
MPSSLCGIVGLKPTTGLTSRSGTIPISFSRDVTGPMGRTVADVATLLGGLVGVDPYDEATAKSAGHFRKDYRRFLDPDGLRGARIGIWRGYDNFSRSDASNVIVEELIARLPDLGATVIDPADIPHAFDITGSHTGVMFHEFKEGIARYLSGLTGTDMRSLADLIAFNNDHAAEELRWHDQGLFDYANTLSTKDPDYRTDFRTSLRLGRQGFASIMERHRLDALFAPTFAPAWAIDLVTGDLTTIGNGCAGPSNAAGYPHITVPAGYVGELPIGVSFMARAWEEPKLFRYAYAFEQAIQARHAPKFLETYGVNDFVAPADRT